MKLRLGDTVIELEHVAYAKKVSNYLVAIYFIGLKEPLSVRCGTDEGSLARYPGDAESLMSKIESHKKEENITFQSSIE